MRVYAAGIYATRFDLRGTTYGRLTEAECAARYGATHFLESYLYLGDNPRLIENIGADGVKIFVDCGAYSAYAQGATITRPKYIEFIHEYQDIIATFDGIQMMSVLDVIDAAARTHRNLRSMEDERITPITCAQNGEDLARLDEYAEQYKYVSLGGMVGPSRESLRAWLDPILRDRLVDDDARMRCKVYAFGLTSVPLLTRHRQRLASLDSTIWLQWAYFSAFLMPNFGMVKISEKSPDANIEGEHFDTFDAVYGEDMRADIEAAGFEVERLRTKQYRRWCWNLRAFQAVGEGKG